MEGSLKYSTHGKLDCTQEGMKLARAFFDIYFNRLKVDPNPSQDLQKNVILIAQDAIRRCNYATSVEGIIVNHLIRKALVKNLGTAGKFIGVGFIVGEILVNLLDDLIGYQLSFMGFRHHLDFFNAGLILGRLTKGIVQFYMEGWYELFLDVEHLF